MPKLLFYIGQESDSNIRKTASLRKFRAQILGVWFATLILSVHSANCEEKTVPYQRRNPQAGVLYQVLQENLNTFFEQVESNPNKSGLPLHVKGELKNYLDCGILAKGFVRIFCESCKRNQLVALSCKHRGFCPSCGGRRMRERSLHLVDRVFPEAPVRQWVLSVPFEVRYLLAYKPHLLTKVLDIYVRVISNFIKAQARAKGLRRVYTGSVTVIQRAGSALNLNTHLHGLFLDGFYAREPGSGKLTFHKIKPPSDDELGELVSKIKKKVVRFLEGQGFLNQHPDDFEADLFESCLAASARYHSATGERAGQRIRMLGRDSHKEPDFDLKGKRCAISEGFSLHANT